MEIKIDTERDSKQDIRKIINFLQSLIDSEFSNGQVNHFNSSSSSKEVNFNSNSNSNFNSNYGSGFNRDLSDNSNMVNNSDNFSNSNNFISDNESRRDEVVKDYDVPGDGLFNIFSDSNSSNTVDVKKENSLNRLIIDDDDDNSDDDDEKNTASSRVDVIPY